MYRFHQGTAMGKASLILVENIKLSVDDDDDDETTKEDETTNDKEGDDDRPKQKQSQKGNVSFTLLGRVEVDDREMIEVEEGN